MNCRCHNVDVELNQKDRIAVIQRRMDHVKLFHPI